MSTILPPKCHYGAQAVVSDVMMSASKIPAGEILRRTTYETCQQLVKRLTETSVTTRHIPDTHQTAIEVDVYVFSPAELEDVIAQAREAGQRDAERWMSIS
jgi:hypothetical protein